MEQFNAVSVRTTTATTMSCAPCQLLRDSISVSTTRPSPHDVFGCAAVAVRMTSALRAPRVPHAANGFGEAVSVLRAPTVSMSVAGPPGHPPDGPRHPLTPHHILRRRSCWFAPRRRAEAFRAAHARVGDRRPPCSDVGCRRGGRRPRRQRASCLLHDADAGAVGPQVEDSCSTPRRACDRCRPELRRLRRRRRDQEASGQALTVSAAR